MDINKLSQVIKDGGIAVVPTDTVYGIIADATKEDVIKKVYEVKKRPYSKPLIIMVSSLDMLKEYVEDISEVENLLMEKYWPGRLTILLKKNNKLSRYINNGGDLVGVRLPDNKELIELMEEVGVPLVSTSANLSDNNTITSINLLEEEIVRKVDYIYDGGVIEDVPSTIVRVVDNKVEILREGELASQIRSEFK